MRRLLGPVGERAIVNEIKRFELFTDGRSAMVPLQEPDLIIERSELIRGLAREAQDYGARLELGCRFASLESKGSGVELTFERAGSAAPERVAAESVVGADGAYSAVAKAAGWRAAANGSAGAGAGGPARRHARRLSPRVVPPR